MPGKREAKREIRGQEWRHEGRKEERKEGTYHCARPHKNVTENCEKQIQAKRIENKNKQKCNNSSKKRKRKEKRRRIKRREREKTKPKSSRWMRNEWTNDGSHTNSKGVLEWLNSRWTHGNTNITHTHSDTHTVSLFDQLLKSMHCRLSSKSTRNQSKNRMKGEHRHKQTSLTHSRIHTVSLLDQLPIALSVRCIVDWAPPSPGSSAAWIACLDGSEHSACRPRIYEAVLVCVVWKERRNKGKIKTWRKGREIQSRQIETKKTNKIQESSMQEQQNKLQPRRVMKINNDEEGKDTQQK